MAKKTRSTTATAGAVVLSLFFGGVVLAFYPGWSAVGRWFGHDSAAAWVQAVGSVVAIIAAAGVAVYQVDHARRLEEDRRKTGEIQRLSVVVALMARSYGLAKDVVTAFRDPSDYHFSVIDTPLMRDTVETLRALPLFEIPGGMAAIDIRSTARYLDMLADNWESMVAEVQASGAPPSEQSAGDMVSFCEELMVINDEAMKECKAAISARGGKWI
ncbi:hypothetical protein EC845_2549 [Comamonas sp. BIGb0124]|uniref:hypothetical protein n=1 Tax=Comamonas sp. BIGb0124 TaxID=2485130 RepID=UPI000F9DE8D5|nr:hypothetical protein [Comamonas sp. BIGb0124]ROR21726.1 hypothetical protein EC845_2549 [Comamonas sp. BIGb0124]